MEQVKVNELCSYCGSEDEYSFRPKGDKFSNMVQICKSCKSTIVICSMCDKDCGCDSCDYDKYSKNENKRRKEIIGG